jgi:hypothetical protein
MPSRFEFWLRANGDRPCNDDTKWALIVLVSFTAQVSNQPALACLACFVATDWQVKGAAGLLYARHYCNGISWRCTQLGLLFWPRCFHEEML